MDIKYNKYENTIFKKIKKMNIIINLIEIII